MSKRTKLITISRRSKALKKMRITKGLPVRKVADLLNGSYTVDGMNDWVSGVDKVLTGVPCLSILSQYDTFHSSFKALDELDGVRKYQTPRIQKCFRASFKKPLDNKHMFFNLLLNTNL